MNVQATAVASTVPAGERDREMAAEAEAFRHCPVPRELRAAGALQRLLLAVDPQRALQVRRPRVDGEADALVVPDG